MFAYSHMKNPSANIMYVRYAILTGMIYLGKKIWVGLAEVD